GAGGAGEEDEKGEQQGEPFRHGVPPAEAAGDGGGGLHVFSAPSGTRIFSVTGATPSRESVTLYEPGGSLTGDASGSVPRYFPSTSSRAPAQAGASTTREETGNW